MQCERWEKPEYYLDNWHYFLLSSGVWYVEIVKELKWHINSKSTTTNVEI